MRSIFALLLIGGGAWQMWAVLSGNLPSWEKSILAGQAPSLGFGPSGGQQGSFQIGNPNSSSSNQQGTTGLPPGQGVR